MPKPKLTQEEFDEILRKAKTSGRLEPSKCVFPNCAEPPDLNVQKPGREYGMCAEHWWLVSDSDVEL